MITRILALLVLVGLPTFAQSPKLLLTSQRLKRLERERDRQTERWLNFERRIQTVPDSPERGFELGLYFAITKDAEKGKAAVVWALSHPCQRRQAALVLDWVGSLANDHDRASMLSRACPDNGGTFQKLRDSFFIDVAKDDPRDASASTLPIPELPDPENLYALVEYVDAYRSTQFTDLRMEQRALFAQLPAMYLLSLHPDEVAHPSWQQRVAALALVALDPNLPESQFLQGWASEDRNMIRDGPGVGYELLWANPYLPGISYQNRDPWLYSEQSEALWARSDWSPEACWILIGKNKVDQRNCAPGWDRTASSFGNLTLLPVRSCQQVPEVVHDKGGAVIVRAAAGAKLTYLVSGAHNTAQTDAAGLWRVPENVAGKICLASSAGNR